MDKNGFIATIVEQSDTSKKGILTDEASTIVEKFRKPIIGKGRMDEAKEDLMSEFGEFEYQPTLCLNDKQLPTAKGLQVGDKVKFEIEAEVSNYNFNEDEYGKEKHEYVFKLKRGLVKK